MPGSRQVNLEHKQAFRKDEGFSLRAHLEAKGQFCTNCQQPEALCRCIKRRDA